MICVFLMGIWNGIFILWIAADSIQKIIFYWIRHIMIKGAIIVGGLVFYAFVITTLIRDISNHLTIQEIKTSPNPSSGSSIMTKTESSPSKKWRSLMPAQSMTARNSWKSSDNTEEEPTSTNSQNSLLPRQVTFLPFSLEDGWEMCW